MSSYNQTREHCLSKKSTYLTIFSQALSICFPNIRLLYKNLIPFYLKASHPTVSNYQTTLSMEEFHQFTSFSSYKHEQTTFLLTLQNRAFIRGQNHSIYSIYLEPKNDHTIFSSNIPQS